MKQYRQWARMQCGIGSYSDGHVSNSFYITGSLGNGTEMMDVRCEVTTSFAKSTQELLCTNTNGKVLFLLLNQKPCVNGLRSDRDSKTPSTTIWLWEQMANFVFTSTQKWMHMRSLTSQEYTSALKHDWKIFVVQMDSYYSWCIGRSGSMFDESVDTGGQSTGQCLR